MWPLFGQNLPAPPCSAISLAVHSVVVSVRALLSLGSATMTNAFAGGTAARPAASQPASCSAAL